MSPFRWPHSRGIDQVAPQRRPSTSETICSLRSFSTSRMAWQRDLPRTDASIGAHGLPDCYLWKCIELQPSRSEMIAIDSSPYEYYRSSCQLEMPIVGKDLCPVYGEFSILRSLPMAYILAREATFIFSTTPQTQLCKQVTTSSDLRFRPLTRICSSLSTPFT